MSRSRVCLTTVSPEDAEYKDFFPEAIDELESKLPGEQYVAFLEELYETRHDVFSLSADWHVRRWSLSIWLKTDWKMSTVS